MTAIIAAPSRRPAAGHGSAPGKPCPDTLPPSPAAVSLRGLRVAGVPVVAFPLRSYGTTLAGCALGLAVAAPLRALLAPDRLSLLLLFGVLWLAIVALPAPCLLLRPDQRAWLTGAATRFMRRQG